MTNKIKASEDLLELAGDSLDDVDWKRNNIQDKIKKSNGSMNETGIEMVKLRRNLMYTYDSQMRIRAIDDEIRECELKRLTFREEVQLLSVPEEQIIEELLAKRKLMRKPDLTENPTPKEIQLKEDQFKENAVELIASKQEYLSTLDKDYQNYINSLTQEREKLVNLVKKVSETRDFLADNVLWLQTASPLNILPSSPGDPEDPETEVDPSDLEDATSAIVSFFNVKKWERLSDRVVTNVKHRKYQSVLFGLVLLGLFVVSRRLKGLA